MSISRCASFLVLCACLGAAHAQSAKTREEVRNELLEAQRNGDVLAPGESGLTLRELHPQRYGVAPTPAKTRAQVTAEFAAAQRAGDTISSGEIASTQRELNPQRYSAPIAVAGKTREQVKAELSDAVRTGDVIAHGESGLKLNELHPQWYARQHDDAASRHAASSSGTSLR